MFSSLSYPVLCVISKVVLKPLNVNVSHIFLILDLAESKPAHLSCPLYYLMSRASTDLTPCFQIYIMTTIMHNIVLYKSHSTKVKEFELKDFPKNNTTNLFFSNFNFNSEQLTVINHSSIQDNLHNDARVALFVGFPILKCHPCFHDKKPLFLNKIIIEVIFFLHT